MNISISVIIPMYNVEKWIANCLDNILNQTFKNIELILVNDGSPDNSGEIAETFARDNIRVRVIHKENGGVSSARNSGIDSARGKYVSFIDPDDEISDDFFHQLYQIAENNNCDVVIAGFQTVPTNNEVSPNFTLNTLMDGKKLVLSSPKVHTNNDLCFSCKNLYKLSFIMDKNIRFNENISIGEDTIFNLESFLESERVYAIKNAMYLYTVNNPDSTMRTLYKPNLEKSLILQYQLRKKLSEKFDLMSNAGYRKDMANYYLKSIFGMIINNLKNSSKSDIQAELKRILRLEMFTDSTKEIGFSYHCENYREYLYYLAMKYKFTPLIKKGFSIN